MINKAKCPSCHHNVFTLTELEVKTVTHKLSAIICEKCQAIIDVVDLTQLALIKKAAK